MMAGVSAPIKVALAIDVVRTATKPIIIDAPKKKPGTTHALKATHVNGFPHSRLAMSIAGAPNHIRYRATV
jgi:hypothetical protein